MDLTILYDRGNVVPMNISIDCPACPFCGQVTSLVVPADGYYAWKDGEYIQVALADLSVDEREILMTGTHPDCWDEAFPEDDEDDGDPDEYEPDLSFQFEHDSAMTSIGWGTDEDYGYYGGDDY